MAVPSNLKLTIFTGLPRACSCATSPGPTVCRRIVPFVVTDNCIDDASVGVVGCKIFVSTSMSTVNFSKSASTGCIPNCDVIVLVNGLRRSIVSCLTVSDRSTTPVVMLVLRDLPKYI